MGFFDKERKKERNKVFSFNIVDKFVNKLACPVGRSFQYALSNTTGKLILVVDISRTMLESPHFEIILSTARKKFSPCFFIIDNSVLLPADWDRGLNILFLDYYSNLIEYQELETRAMESAYKYCDTGEI
jgi:hypothetical protein